MPRFRPKGVLERNPAEDLWKHTLSRIPTVYGRLMYLASLRDQNSGIYRHHGLSAAFGREESSRALKESHRRTFLEWLNLPLSEKNHDLALYLEALEDPRLMVVDHWLRSKLYKTHVPVSARKRERELFVSDLQALLETIRNGLRGAESVPVSSQLE
jgi:hypothetical protein